MKSDARLFLNNKKKRSSSNLHVLTWKKQAFKSQAGDARNILNVKRHQQKSKSPVFGTFMRTNSASDFIASQIRKEILPSLKGSQKKIEVARDGNLIITTKSKNPLQAVAKKGLLQERKFDFPSSSRSIQPTSVYEQPSTSNLDDLENTTLQDLLDVESLPSTYFSSKAFPVANLSRKAHTDINQILESRTMIADQLSQPPKISCAKVYVSNLHPSVSQQDLVELFTDVGIIKEAEMLMPGTAIIDFFNAEDATRACATYHNRLLDGLPMKCYLQTQKPHPQRSTISQRLGNRIVAQPSPSPKPVSSIITNPRSRINPRNVQFTVKLA